MYKQLFEDKADHYINLFNEFCASIYLYLMMILTDFHGENRIRDSIGVALLILVVLVVLVNIVKKCYDVFYPLLLKYIIRKVANYFKTHNNKVVAPKPLPSLIDELNTDMSILSRTNLNYNL